MNITIILPIKDTMPTREEYSAREEFEAALKLPSGSLVGHDMGEGTMQAFIDDIEDEYVSAVAVEVISELQKRNLIKEVLIRFY